MIATVVRAAGAPGPTLVVELSELPLGALVLRTELRALRESLEGSRYGRLAKIALYGPSGAPGTDLDYRFVQAMPDGSFDFRTGCGHSLLACVAAAGSSGAVTVRAVTTGDEVVCASEQPLGGAPDAYTLHFLRAPDAPGVLPTGRPLDRLDGVPVSLVRYGNPYVFVDARDLGIRSRDQLFAAGETILRRLLALRALAAEVLGHPPHSALPKIAAVDYSAAIPAVRAVTVGGWHPSLALTGATALAAAAALCGTVVRPLDGVVDTPGGPVTVSSTPNRVSVHHKRATVLRRLELPWRIHATA